MRAPPKKRGRKIAPPAIAARLNARVTLEAQADGSVGAGCRPEAVAQFIVASLEGAILMTKLTKDIAVMERCVEELQHYLTLYEVKA